MNAPQNIDGHDDEERLRVIADALNARYPDEADREERDAAFTTARRLVAGDDSVVDELAAELAALRRAEARTKASLAQAARMVIQPGTRGPHSESAFARRVGVNRLTIRDWLGKDS